MPMNAMRNKTEWCSFIRSADAPDFIELRGKSYKLLEMLMRKENMNVGGDSMTLCRIGDDEKNFTFIIIHKLRTITGKTTGWAEIATLPKSDHDEAAMDFIDAVGTESI